MAAPTTKSERVAIVHDWLTGMRGGERVLEVFLRLYPEADLFALFHLPGSVSPAIESRLKGVSFLQGVPGLARLYRYYLPLFPFAVEQLPTQGYDKVISLSHCAAMGALSGDEAVHLNYLFTPMRYLYGPYEVHFTGKSTGLRRNLMEVFFHRLRRWEVVASQRADGHGTISACVQRRVWKRLRQRAEVIHPPVAPLFLEAGAGGQREDVYLIVSALVPYKRLEIALEAFRQSGRRLRIVGQGPAGESLRQRAPANVEFLGHQPDAEVVRQYQTCRALLFPGHEDFGLTPLEAQACGMPVVAYGGGGVVEACHPATTFFDEATPEALNAALDRFEATSPAPEALTAFAATFSEASFAEKWRAFERSLGKN